MAILNMEITKASLFLTECDNLTFKLTVQNDVYTCDIGYWDITRWNPELGKFEETPIKGSECIGMIMKTVGVTRWEDLVGKYIRIDCEGPGHTVIRIGNIISDKWFNIWHSMDQTWFIPNESAYLRCINPEDDK